MQNRIFKTKSASSLIEVIIVLAIVSFTIIASMALVARTRLEIKNNEIADNANGVLLQALEALKTPTNVLLNGNVSLTGVGPYYFSLKKDANNNYLLYYQMPGSFTSLPKSTDSFKFEEICTPNNAFFLTDGQNFNYCQQVEIAPITRTATQKIIYKVTTTIIYKTSNQSRSETLTTYRYEGFKKIV